jgi:hypothetical protein
LTWRLTRTEMVMAGSATAVSAMLGALLWVELLPAAVPQIAAGTRRPHVTASQPATRAHVTRTSHQPDTGPRVIVVTYQGSRPHPSTGPAPHTSPAQYTTTPPVQHTTPPPHTTTPSPSPAPSPSTTQPVVSTDPLCVTLLVLNTCLPIGVTP